MRMDDDFEENGAGMPVIYMALGVSVFILAVLGIVLAINKDNRPSKNSQIISDMTTVAVEQATPEPVEEKETLVASDLDIWDMYPEKPQDKKQDKDKDKDKDKDPDPTEEAEKDAVTPEVDYNDGKHVEIKYSDGSSEWIAINEKLEKNNYDFSNLVDSGGKKKYISDGKNVAFLGIDVSRYQKTIDFSQVADQGIDFVMIRVGARGYKTGQLTLDECFEENLKNAKEAGLKVGLYFYSQAISTQEATEEATMIINAIGENKIDYPIAIDMEMVDNDLSRVETLSKDERTVITAAFVNTIKDAGYIPMIYGDKDWLLKRIDVSKFTQSRIWLAQDDEVPDYPYTFDMWQYTTDGSVYGIDGSVDLNLCFVDYDAQ